MQANCTSPYVKECKDLFLVYFKFHYFMAENLHITVDLHFEIHHLEFARGLFLHIIVKRNFMVVFFVIRLLHQYAMQ